MPLQTATKEEQKGQQRTTEEKKKKIHKSMVETLKRTNGSRMMKERQTKTK